MITVSMAIEDKALWGEVHSCLESESVQIDSEQSHVDTLGHFLGSLERSRTDIALIDISVLREPLHDAICKIRAAAPESMIVALNTIADTGTVLECFRAGADEYLVPPLEDGLKKALARRERERRQLESGKPGGKIVLFASAAGGCGATTLACHVATELSRLGDSVLLADLNLSGGMVGFVMKSASAYSFADALNNVHRLDASFWKALVSKAIPNLEVISAPTGIARGDSKVDDIRQVLGFTRTQYHWTVADAGGCMNQSAMTALEAADELCLVTTPEMLALHQTKQILQRVLDCGYDQQRLRLILNRVAKHSRIRPEDIQQMLGIPIYGVLPENDAELYEAYSQGQLLPPRSELGRCMERLARKLAGVESLTTKRKMHFFG